MIELGQWMEQSAGKHLPVVSAVLSSYTDWIAMIRTPLYSHGPSDLAAHPQARKFAEYISTQNHNVILIKDSQILEPRLPAPIHKRISNRCGTWLLEYLNSPAPQIAGFFVYCMN
jgi:hypothetical protein